jgi:hypothetical protein
MVRAAGVSSWDAVAPAQRSCRGALFIDALTDQPAKLGRDRTVLALGDRTKLVRHLARQPDREGLELRLLRHLIHTHLMKHTVRQL